MNVMKVFYYFALLGLLCSLILHTMTFIEPDVLFTSPKMLLYAFVGLSIGGLCLCILPIVFENKKRYRPSQHAKRKEWMFFRYIPQWLSVIILAEVLYGGIYFASLFLQEHEGKDILEQHNYSPDWIVGEDLRMYQAYQHHIIRSLFGLFISIYSLVLLLISSKLYKPVESFFVILGKTQSAFVRKITPLLLSRCKKGTLQPMIQALRTAPPAFRKTLLMVLRDGGDSRSVRPLLTMLKEVEPSPLQELLHIFLQHSCRHLKQLVFGQQGSKQHNLQHTLYNPDVSRLTVSMPHLKNIVIDPGTYDFHCVERFLTYAINYIGQPYLKKHVHVHILGDSDELHPNIKNSLTNLCRSISYQP